MSVCGRYPSLEPLADLALLASGEEAGAIVDTRSH